MRKQTISYSDHYFIYKVHIVTLLVKVHCQYTNRDNRQCNILILSKEKELVNDLLKTRVTMWVE